MYTILFRMCITHASFHYKKSQNFLLPYKCLQSNFRTPLIPTSACRAMVEKVWPALVGINGINPNQFSSASAQWPLGHCSTSALEDSWCRQMECWKEHCNVSNLRLLTNNLNVINMAQIIIITYPPRATAQSQEM